MISDGETGAQEGIKDVEKSRNDVVEEEESLVSGHYERIADLADGGKLSSDISVDRYCEKPLFLTSLVFITNKVQPLPTLSV